MDDIRDLDDCRSIERALAELSEKCDGLPENYPMRRDLARMISQLKAEVRDREKRS
jgi:hypothetical protein